MFSHIFSNRSKPRATSQSVLIDTLESRQLLSATLAAHPAAPLHAPAKPAIHQTLAPAKAATKPVKAAKTVTVKPVKAIKTVQSVKPSAQPASTQSTTQSVQSGDVTTGYTGVYIGGPITNCVGQWTGSIQLDASGTASPISVLFTSQHGVSVTGNFSLGALFGNAPILSTAVLGTYKSFRVLINPSGIDAGFTGVIANGGTLIYGRWSYDSPTGWQTGTFTLSKS